MIENYMAQLAKELESEEPFPQEMPGIYSFPLEHTDVLISKVEPEGFSMSCVVGPCPKGNLEIFYAELLGANLFGGGTRGAVLGLDEEGGNITLSKTIPFHVNYQEFHDALEDFTNVVDFWYEEAQSKHV